MTNTQKNAATRTEAKAPRGGTRKNAGSAPASPPAAKTVIDAALMEHAIALRKEGKTMNAIGDELGVRATAYLAKKIKQHYGADALDKPAAAAAPATAEPSGKEA